MAIKKPTLNSEIEGVYNRLQRAHKGIGELRGLLTELRDVNDNRDQHSDDYLEDLDDRIDTAQFKYGDINGD